MDAFTPWSALAGGALIGLAASAMMLFNGRIAGISGIIGGLWTPRAGDIAWRLAFAAGLLGALLSLHHHVSALVSLGDRRRLPQLSLSVAVAAIQSHEGLLALQAIFGLESKLRASMLFSMLHVQDAKLPSLVFFQQLLGRVRDDQHGLVLWRMSS